MSKRQFFINLISNIVALITSLIISFILTPYLVNTIGKEAYSFYPISTNFVNYMSLITTALNSMSSRFITIEILKNNYDKAKKYYSSVFFANCLMSLILLFPMIYIIIKMETFMDIPNNLIIDVKILFLFVFISMLINLISSIFGVAAFALNRLDLSSYKDIFQGIFKILLFFILYKFFKPSIVFIGVVNLVLSVTNLIFQLILTKGLLPSMKLSYKYFDFRLVKELFNAGIWNSINSLGSILMYGVSLLLANIFINASASGELSIVQTLPHFLSSIITMLVAVFMPRITHLYAKESKQLLVDEMIFSQKVISFFTTVPVALIIIFGKEFFSFWVPNEDSYKLQILSILSIIPLLIHGNMWSITGLNTVLNKVKIPSIALIGSGLINIFLCFITLDYIDKNLFIIPLISSIISILYYLFFIPIYASEQLKIKKITFYPTIVKSIIFTLIFTIIGNYFKSFIVITTFYDLILWGGIFGVIGIIVHFLLLIKKDEFNKLIHILLKK